jgi:hypothetical protein
LVPRWCRGNRRGFLRCPRWFSRHRPTRDHTRQIHLFALPYILFLTLSRDFIHGNGRQSWIGAAVTRGAGARQRCWGLPARGGSGRMEIPSSNGRCSS